MLLSFTASAQLNTGCKAGFIYQRSSYIEGGLLLYKRPQVLNSRYDMWAVNIGSGFRVGGSKFIMAPDISFEIHVLVFSARFSAVCFTDFKQNALSLAPEIGVGFLGYIYLMGGYNWTISNPGFWNTTGSKVSIGTNFSGWKTH